MRGNPFAVTPALALANPGQTFVQGYALADAIRQRKEQREAQEAAQQRANVAMSAWQNADDDVERAAIMRQFPELAEQLGPSLEFFDDMTAQWHLDDYTGVYNASSVEEGAQILRDRVRRLESLGADSAATRRDLEKILNSESPDQMRALAEIELMGRPQGVEYLQQRKKLGEKDKPLSDFGKLAHDYMKLPEKSPLRPRFEAAMAMKVKEAGGDTADIKNYNQWLELNKPYLEGLPKQDAQREMARAFDRIVSPPQVVATGGGGYALVDRVGGGRTDVVSPDEAISNEARETGAVRQAEDSAAEIPKVISKAGTVRGMVNKYDQAINAIDRGAGTGPIQKLVPSVRSATIELENLQNLLGLDIIAEGSFGQLSEGELKMAFETGLPTGLDEPALRDWLQRKRDAQLKVVEELEDYALFLGRGGTQAQFLEQRGAAPGAPAVDGGTDGAPLPPTGEEPVTVNSKADYEALPPGAEYIYQGAVYRKGS